MHGRFVTKEQVENREPGLSMAERTGSAPIEGVDTPAGEEAGTVWEQIAAIARRAVPLLAKPNRPGVIKASKDVGDPTALEVSEKGAAGGVAAQDDFAGHLSDFVDAHDASNISYAGSTGLQSTDVEAAIDELDGEKAPNGHGHALASESGPGFTSRDFTQAEKTKLAGLAEGGGTPDATEATAGKSEKAVIQEVRDADDQGDVGPLHVPPSVLKAYLDERLATEVRHEVGAAGEPAFAGGWVNFGDPWEAAGFYKAGGGRVFLSGLLKNGNSGTGFTVFILPAGYRPAKQRRFICACGSFGTATIDVFPDGRIVPTNVPNTAYLSLETVSFRAAA